MPLLAAAYTVLCIFFYLVQDHLIFYPTGVWRDPQGPHVRPLAIERDGTVLDRWIVNSDDTGPLLVYYGGNAEELSGLADVFARLDCTTLLMNYRGYGASEGSPSISELKDDATAVLNVLIRRYGSDRSVILFGRSLGSASPRQWRNRFGSMA